MQNGLARDVFIRINNKEKVENCTVLMGKEIPSALFSSGKKATLPGDDHLALAALYGFCRLMH